MKSYYRVMLGSKSRYAEECLKGNFIGTDFLPETNLTSRLAEDWRAFNQEFIPVWLKHHPDKSKISAGLSMGALWRVSKGIRVGDVVLCPTGGGSYYAGEVVDGYSYHPGGVLPHRRAVKWYSASIERAP